MRANLRVAIFNMCSKDASCLADSMTHLFRTVDSDTANNYKTALITQCFFLLCLRDERDATGQSSHSLFSAVCLFSFCSPLTLLYLIPSGTKIIITS